MARILKTRQSRKDYVSIEDYISKTSSQNAELIIRLFEEKLQVLAAHNLMGRPRPELAPNLRSWNIHRFVMFYRPTEDGIILIRVLHASMDITPHYFASS
jgi:toxin ParE1/3/4